MKRWHCHMCVSHQVNDFFTVLNMFLLFLNVVLNFDSILTVQENVRLKMFTNGNKLNSIARYQIL